MAAATVTELTPRTSARRRRQRPMTVAAAIEGFLATPRCHQSPHTHRAYLSALHRVADYLDPSRELADVGDHEIGEAISTLWGHSAPTTFNRNRAAVGSWLTWCATKAKWTAPALPGTCERRKEPADETRAVTPAVIERICTRRDVPLRERVLWRMLYETASRASAVLACRGGSCDKVPSDSERPRGTFPWGWSYTGNWSMMSS